MLKRKIALSKPPQSEINITPMVDIMLVLLIIFMIATPLMQRTITVTLPETKGAATPIQESQLILTLKKNGDIYFNQSQITKTALLAALKKIQPSPKRPVYLRADKNLSYGGVLAVMDIAKKSGHRLSLITRAK